MGCLLQKVTEADHPTINSWLSARGCKPFEKFPKIGFIDPGVAAGFLVTDGSFGFLEGFVANPFAKPKDVKEAFVRIFRTIQAVAAGMSLAQIVVLSRKRSIIRLSELLGFTSKNGPWSVMGMRVQ